MWSPLPLFSIRGVYISTPRADKTSSQHCMDFAKYVCRGTHRFRLVSICSVSIGEITTDRQVYVKGRRPRVDDRVKAKRKRGFSVVLWSVMDEFRAPLTLLSRRRRFARLWSTTRIVRVSSLDLPSKSAQNAPYGSLSDLINSPGSP